MNPTLNILGISGSLRQYAELLDHLRYHEYNKHKQILHHV